VNESSTRPLMTDRRVGAGRHPRHGGRGPVARPSEWRAV